jgi:biopolymer transport protein ExbD
VIEQHTREHNNHVAINLTPLIDMVFILLIFFAVNSTFVKFPGVEVDQPVARSAVVLESATILVAVTANGEIWVDRNQVDIRRLRGVIERLLVETPDASVVVLSDQNSRTGIVVDVIDQARLAGADKVALAAAAPEQELGQ